MRIVSTVQVAFDGSHQEGHADIQQARGWVSRGGASADPIHLAIAGFNPKATMIELEDLQRLGTHPIAHVSESLAALAAIASLAVFAGEGQVDGFSAERLVVQGVRR